MDNDPRIPIPARDELALLRQQLANRDRTIASLHRAIDSQDVEIKTLTAELETLPTQVNETSHYQVSGVRNLPVSAPSFHDDMDLDTVSHSEKFVKFGKWLPMYVEASSAAGHNHVPDCFMWRLWLGIHSYAKIDNLTSADLDYCFAMMRKESVVSAAEVPAGHLKLGEKRKRLSEFTGFSKAR
jgi:hypothetical protein